MIPAKECVVGQKYKSSNGILVEVLEKRLNDVVVRSFETGNIVPVALDYKLDPIIDLEKVEVTSMESNMPNDTAAVAPAPTKTKKLKKSNIVDDGLKAGLAVDDIVKNVLASFPEAQDKSVRNLISVRRSKLKKTA